MSSQLVTPESDLYKVDLSLGQRQSCSAEQSSLAQRNYCFCTGVKHCLQQALLTASSLGSCIACGRNQNFSLYMSKQA